MTSPDRPRRLYRSRSDRMIGGVAGGVGRYFGIDPTLVRLAFVVLLFAGVGFLAYIVAWIVVPKEPIGGDPSPPRSAAAGTGARMIAGAVLIAVGVVMLIEWAVPSLDDYLWPIALIGVGVGVIVYGSRR